MIHVIALDITFGIHLNCLNIKSHSKVVKCFLKLYQNAGGGPGSATGPGGLYPNRLRGLVGPRGGLLGPRGGQEVPALPGRNLVP